MRTFETPGPLALDLRAPAGRIEVETVDGTQTEVDLQPLFDDEESRAAAEGALVELRERRGGHELVVEVRDRRGDAEVMLRVRCPHGADLEARSASADIEARGRFGAANVETASGDVSLEETAGDVQVKTASGDSTLGRIGGDGSIQSASGDVEVSELTGPGKIRTASGDVLVHEARSSLSVHSASGDQEIEAVQQGEITLQSASGDLSVGVRAGSTLWVDARSMSGDTTSELEVSDAPPAEEGPLVELKATSMSGDVQIRRAVAS